MIEKDKEIYEIVEKVSDKVIESLKKHNENQTEVYMKSYYSFLNEKLGIDFDNEKDVKEFRGAIRLVIKFYNGIEKASSIIGTTVLIGILTGFGYIIKLGIEAYTKIK